MTTAPQRYPDLGSLIAYILNNSRFRHQNQLAAYIDVNETDLSRVKNDRSYLPAQLRVANRILKKARDLLTVEQVAWLEQFEVWCHKRSYGEIYDSWEDYWRNLQILARDAPASENVRPERTPMEFVAEPPYFVGREKELRTILDSLKPGKIVTVCGPGGIGKTALAAKAVKTIFDTGDLFRRFPDGVVRYDFYADNLAENALAHFAISFGLEPIPTPASAARRAMASRQALLILDGADNADNLRAVLAERGNCGVLITTRSVEDSEEDWLELTPLDFQGEKSEAVTLLQQWGHGRIKDRVIAYQICTLVGGLPLAIRIAGSYVAKKGTMDDYLEWLKTTPLAALDDGQRIHESIPLLLEHSVNQIPPAARDILAVLGLLALSPCDRDVITLAVSSGLEVIRPSLATLVNYSLLERVSTRYQVSHVLVHTFARERMSPPSGSAERLIAHYAEFLRDFIKLARVPHKLVDAEHPHVLALVNRCYELGEWQDLYDLSELLHVYLELRGNWWERVNILQKGLRAARELKVSSEVSWLSNLGYAYQKLGQMSQAVEYHQQAVDSARKAGDRRNEGISLGGLGRFYLEKGQLLEALTCLQESLKIEQEIEDRVPQELILENLGETYRLLGRFEDAMQCLTEALRIARRYDNWRSEGTLLGHLSRVHRELGQYDVAIEYLGNALMIAQNIGDKLREECWLGEIGIVRTQLGQVEEAQKNLQDAISIAQELGDSRNEAVWLGALADILINKNELREALRLSYQSYRLARGSAHYLQQCFALNQLGRIFRYLGRNDLAWKNYLRALAIAREREIENSSMQIVTALAELCHESGAVEQAIQWFAEAEALARKSGNRNAQGQIFLKIAFLFREVGEVERAVKCCETALGLVYAVNVPALKEAILLKLGELQLELGKPSEALSSLMAGLTLARANGNRRHELMATMNIGGTYDTLEEYDQAISSYHHSLDIAEEIGDREINATILRNIAVIYNKQKKSDLAVQYWQRAIEVVHEEDDVKREAKWLAELGELYENLHRMEDARWHLSKAIAVARTCEDNSIVESALWTLARVCMTLDQTDEAIEHYKDLVLVSQQTKQERHTAAAYIQLGFLSTRFGHTRAAQTYVFVN